MEFPVVRSLQGTVFLADKQVEPDLRKFVQEGADWVIFTTGIGTETLLDLADKLGFADQFLNSFVKLKWPQEVIKHLLRSKS